MTESKEITKRPTDRLKEVMYQPTVQEQFRNALGDNSGTFIASLIDLYGSDGYLQQCQPSAVVMEALKAATLKLPINKSLGFAYVIPYQNNRKQPDGSWKKVYEPNFQIGYKGLIQLAMRTGHYRYINADKVLEGELKKKDKLTGEIELGEPTGDITIGYFAMMETVSGFRKVIYWTVSEIEAHAKRFSKSYDSKYTPWKTDFDAMALKTVLKALLGKYGIMSVEMANLMASDQDIDARTQAEIDENANKQDLDFPGQVGTQEAEYSEEPITPEEAAEIEAQEQATGTDGPGW